MPLDICSYLWQLFVDFQLTLLNTVTTGYTGTWLICYHYVLMTPKLLHVIRVRSLVSLLSSSTWSMQDNQPAGIGKIHVTEDVNSQHLTDHDLLRGLAVSLRHGSEWCRVYDWCLWQSVIYNLVNNWLKRHCDRVCTEEGHFQHLLRFQNTHTLMFHC